MRQLRVLAMVAAVLVTAELGARAVEPRLPPPRLWPDPRHAQKIDQMEAVSRGADVVFAGTSQMLYAVDPAMLAAGGARWTSYNAAVPAAPVEVQRHWLETVVLPRLQPDALVLGISMIDVSESSERERFLRAYFDSPAVRADLLGRVQRWAARHSSLTRNRDALRSPFDIVRALADVARGRSRHQNPKLNPLGWGHTNAVADFRVTAAELQLQRTVLSEFRVSRHRTRAILGLAERLDRRGIATVIIDLPLSNAALDLLPDRDGDIEAYRSWLREVADAGTPVLHLSEDLTDHAYFADTLHLNGRGTAAVTAAVADALSGHEPGAFASALSMIEPAAGG